MRVILNTTIYLIQTFESPATDNTSKLINGETQHHDDEYANSFNNAEMECAPVVALAKPLYPTARNLDIYFSREYVVQKEWKEHMQFWLL